jgi:hypothetical protein
MTTAEHDTIIDREWAMQERACTDDRSEGVSPRGARMARYRFVAHCLRKAPEPALPDDFASTCAQRIEAEARRARASRASFERSLVAASVLLYGSAMIAAALAFGVDAVSMLALLEPVTRAVPWLLALMACVGTSHAFGRMRRRSA